MIRSTISRLSSESSTQSTKSLSKKFRSVKEINSARCEGNAHSASKSPTLFRESCGGILDSTTTFVIQRYRLEIWRLKEDHDGWDLCCAHSGFIGFDQVEHQCCIIISLLRFEQFWSVKYEEEARCIIVTMNSYWQILSASSKQEEMDGVWDMRIHTWLKFLKLFFSFFENMKLYFNLKWF